VAEERDVVVPELRTLLLEFESESIVGGSEVVYSHRRRQRKAKRDAFARCAPRLYQYWLVYATAATLVVALEALEGPRGPPLSN
jgi:hypothetical protein